MEIDMMLGNEEKVTPEGARLPAAPSGINSDFWKAQLIAPPTMPNGMGTVKPKTWAVTLEKLAAAPNDQELRAAIHSRLPDVDIDDLIRRMQGQKASEVGAKPTSTTAVPAASAAPIITDAEFDKAVVEKAKELGSRFTRYYEEPK